MRLDKMLSNMGVGTRKEVKELLKKKHVTVNGVLNKNGSTHIDENKDIVKVKGVVIHYRKFIYLLLNKPAGYLSATRDKHDQTVIDLVKEDVVHFEPFPVGRLDKDTEGLLLLTNDGDLAHQLLSPSKGIEKTYYAIINGRVTEEDAAAFKNGVILDDGYKTKPAALTIITSGKESEIELTITEGKFHQVKRMFMAREKEVAYLKRIRMGDIELDPDLSLGEYRELTETEMQYCESIKNNSKK